jgi:hypothetical protein
MQTERRNPPHRSNMAESENRPARSEMAESGKSKGREKPLERELDGDPIIAELRRLYEGVVDEPLPDELMELLRKLDEVERSR